MMTTTEPTNPTMAERIAQHGIKMTITPIDQRPGPDNDDWDRAARHYRVTISAKDCGRMVIYYSQGSAHTEPPQSHDVLDAVVSDAECGTRDFAEFCSDLGYDEDSRKAERTYKACERSYRALVRMFGPDAVDALMYHTERE